MHEYNMLVSCPRERERAARSEIQYFIGDLLGDEEIRVYRTPVSGLLACQTSLDPFETICSLRDFADDNPYQFRFAIRFFPIEYCIPTDMQKIVDVAEKLLEKIGESDTFRVTVRRRHTTLETMDVVEKVAAVIPRKVDLDNPDKTLWVEIVGEWTGVSVVVEDQDILSVMTMRDDIY